MSIRIGRQEREPVGAFSASISGSQTIPSGSNTRVEWNAEEFDVSGWHDSTSTKGRYTPQVAGIYRIDVWVLANYAITTSGQYFQAWLFKNGENYREMFLCNYAPNYPRGGSSTLAKANGTTDYFDIYVFQNSGASRSLIESHWTGSLVGRL